MKIFIVLISLFCFFCSYSQEAKQNNEEYSKLNEVSLAVIENVPVYNGCDKSMENEALRQCMNSQITNHVFKNYNLKIAEGLNLRSKTVKINAFFKINKVGNVVDIKVTAPHIDLEKEAIRVISNIPQFTKPGIHRGKPAIVTYFLPIKFTVENSSSNSLSNNKH